MLKQGWTWISGWVFYNLYQRDEFTLGLIIKYIGGPSITLVARKWRVVVRCDGLIHLGNSQSEQEEVLTTVNAE